MNILIVAVILVVLFLLVFVMFSLDDNEEEEGFLSSDDKRNNKQDLEQNQSNKEQTIEVAQTEIPQIESSAERETIVINEQQNNIENIKKQTDEVIENNIETEENTNTVLQPAVTQVTTKTDSTDIPFIPSNVELPEIGSEDDLKFRLNLDERVAIATSITKTEGIAAVVQIRFPDELKKDPDKFLRMLQRAERAIESDYAFPFKGYYLNQLNRVWIFEPSSEEPLSDPLFESLVVAFEVISKFKYALKEDSILAESKARVSVGLSMGSIFKIEHGAANQPVWYGDTIYMAETLADSARDLNIYVDELIHKEALPLFDFREWQPTKLRATLPSVQMFELIDWNNAEEIVSFANHKDPESRRAVAIAFRYLEFLDNNITTLFSLASDPDENVKYEALITMKSIANERMLGILKNIFPETKSPEFRAAILDTFGEIGSREVMPLVAGSTKESNWIVRLAAAKALHKICGKDALKYLEPLVKDADGSVKATANYIFYKEGEGIKYLHTLVELATNLSKRTKFTAIDALLDVGNDLSIKEVIHSFSEQHFDLQRHILRRLETENSKILYQCFLALFKNSGEKIRPYIIEAVRRAGIAG